MTRLPWQLLAHLAQSLRCLVQTLDLLHVALIALLYHLKLLLMLTFQHLESLRLILIRLQLMFQFLHLELAVTDQLSLFVDFEIYIAVLVATLLKKFHFWLDLKS